MVTPPAGTDNAQYAVARHIRKVANADSYSRRVRDVPGWTDYRTGELHEPRKRRREVNRRVRRMQGSRGFVAVNDGPLAAADIARVIGNFVRNHLDGDFFEAAPDHHPRPVGVLHADFHRAHAAMPEKLRRAEFDHARRRLRGVVRGGDPLAPVAARAESDLGVFHDGLASFLIGLQVDPAFSVA